MEVTDPFLNRLRRRRRQPACWFLRYTAPMLNADGTSMLNGEGRWDRIRVLAAMDDREEADRLARLPIKHLLRLPKVGELRLHEPWPWNARRRTFCTYHIAKHQSAAKTALIMRHRGSSCTLHNSYRGLGARRCVFWDLAETGGASHPP